MVTTMVSEISSEDMIAASDSRIVGSGRVNAVTPVKPLQDVPDDGKELPPGNDRTEAESSNLEDVVSMLNDHVQYVQRELLFSIDDDTGRTVIKVLDKETKEIIRQIPPEEALSFARKLNEGADLEIIDTYI